MNRYVAFVFFLVASLVPALAQPSKPAGPPVMPKDAQDALKASTTKIAKSYSLLKDGKTEWTYKVSSLEKGKLDPMWKDMGRLDVYCAVIDPMIPTFTDWKIGNFVVYREQGALWIAEEGDKDTFLRLSCRNWKDPVGK